MALARMLLIEDIDDCKGAMGEISTVATNVATTCLEALVCVDVNQTAL
jgi:hypothetical protein